MSDEYGPYIREFDRFGHLLRRIRVPERFLLDPKDGHPSGDVDSAGTSVELYPANNVTGRQANRGMEGLTITPNGRTLVGIMQNALLQDNGVDPGNHRSCRGQQPHPDGRSAHGPDARVCLRHGRGQPGRGVNEILAINNHEFLVLERDNRTRVPTPPNAVQTPNLKRIYSINLAKPGLTDVSGEESLPQGALDPSIVPVTKTLFLDLLDPIYKVNDTADHQGCHRREDRGHGVGAGSQRRPAHALRLQRQRSLSRVCRPRSTRLRSTAQPPASRVVRSWCSSRC